MYFNGATHWVFSELRGIFTNLCVINTNWQLVLLALKE